MSVKYANNKLPVNDLRLIHIFNTIKQHCFDQTQSYKLRRVEIKGEFQAIKYLI